MTHVRTDGYYVSRHADVIVDEHGGARMELKHYRFIRFYDDGFFVKYLNAKYNSKYEELVAARITEYKQNPTKHSSANVIVGKYQTDSHQVFTEGKIRRQETSESYTIVSRNELLGEDLVEYDFKESKG